MRTILTIIMCIISVNSFCQVNYSTDPEVIKDYEKYLRERKEVELFADGICIWEWELKTEIDTLDFIDEKSPLYPKSDKKYSIFESDIYSFNFIRIDSIDSHLVLYKGRDIEGGLDRFLKDEERLKEAGEIFGYIINDGPVIVFGNSAHNFFKKVKKIKLSSPHAKRIIYDYYQPNYNDKNLFYILKNGELLEINTKRDFCHGQNEQEYYQYIRRHLPKEQTNNNTQ